MANPKFPYVRWRDGRPRSCHGADQRRRGFVDENLKNPDGTWFTLDQAAAFSDRRVAEVKASRGGAAAAARLRAASTTKQLQITVADLLRDWEHSWTASSTSVATRRGYRKCISALLYKPETRDQRAARKTAERAGVVVERQAEAIASMPPHALGKPEFRALHRYMTEARGTHMARAVIAALSAAWTWGTEDTRWRLPPNPRLDMEFEQPPGRVVLITMPEFAALIAAADAIGRPSIGDCMYLGLFTGQRQTDRLRMTDEREVEGRHAFRQSKTGQLVDIKEAPQLATRLDQARARVAAITLRLGLKQRPEQIVINEDNGKPYADKTYGNWFTKVRWLALAGLQHGELAEEAIARGRRQISKSAPDSEWVLRPCPSLAFVNERGEQDFKHDQDLRDTCVMLLDRAGCDLLTICDITGHSYSAAQTIVKHYRARNAQRADTGIDRLVLQVRKEGMT